MADVYVPYESRREVMRIVSAWLKQQQTPGTIKSQVLPIEGPPDGSDILLIGVPDAAIPRIKEVGISVRIA